MNVLIMYINMYQNIFIFGKFKKLITLALRIREPVVYISFKNPIDIYKRNILTVGKKNWNCLHYVLLISYLIKIEAENG